MTIVKTAAVTIAIATIIAIAAAQGCAPPRPEPGVPLRPPTLSPAPATKTPLPSPTSRYRPMSDQTGLLTPIGGSIWQPTGYAESELFRQMINAWSSNAPYGTLYGCRHASHVGINVSRKMVASGALTSTQAKTAYQGALSELGC